MLRTVYQRLFGERIFAGPFRGLHYVTGSVGSVHSAKLLGVYERELWPQVERVIRLEPDVVANVGAGEGYYAVGLAARLPHARVVAFESARHGQSLIREFAARNGAGSRVEVRGTCTPEDLQSVLEGASRPSVVIDAEGAEQEILDPSRVPALRRSCVLVEVHDFIAPIGNLLLERFAPSHRTVEVWSHPRRVGDLPVILRGLALTPWKSRILRALDEQRPGPMRWFWFEPGPS